MSFDGIYDQDVPLRLLRNILRRGRVPSGLLFWGPDGVGKRKTALEFIKAINCHEGRGDACGACLSCRKVANGNHPDVNAVLPQRSSRLIAKEAIEELTAWAALRAIESAWRVFLIEEADRMTETAQNHLLKTLEEPPGQAVFILLTEHPRGLLPTIRSRCQSVRFRTLRPETLKAILQQTHDLPGDVAESLAALSQGQVSRALDLIEGDKRNVVLDLTEKFRKGENPSVLAEVFCKTLDARRKEIEAAAKAEFESEQHDDATRADMEKLKEERIARQNAQVKRDIVEYLYLLATWYRDELVYGQTRDAARVFNRDHLDRLEQGVSADPAAKLDAVEHARLYLDRHISEERVFRDLFLTLAEP